MEDIRFSRSYEYLKNEDIMFGLLESGVQWTDYDVLPIHNETELKNFELQWQLKYFWKVHTDSKSNPDGTKSYRFNIGYSSMHLDHFKQARESYKQVDGLLDGIVKKLGIHEGMPQRDALWLIYNYVCDVASYNLNYVMISDIFVNGRGTCHNYTQAFVELCRYVGIDAYYEAQGGAHAWSRVNFEDKNTNQSVNKFVDLTYGDVHNYNPYTNSVGAYNRNANFLMDSYNRFTVNADFQPNMYDVAGLER